MAYRVVFSDRTQVSVNQHQGEEIIKIQSRVTGKPDYVNLSGSQYKLSTITKVILVPDEIKTLPMIDSGMVKGCNNAIHGEIQKRFLKELQREKPRKWAVFKPAAYAYLHSDKYFENERGGVRTEWCDYTTVGCICKDKKEITTADVKEVMKIMRS